MVEQSLHQRLAVVEGAFDRERVHVVVVRRGHHPALHVGNAAVRKQNEQVSPLAAAERLNRRATGIPGGGDHDGGALAPRRQRVIHQPRQQLHGHVLEGERRAVEQLKQEGARAELGERRHRRMPERAVGLAREPRQIRLGDRVANERANHLDRHLGVGPAGKTGNALRRKPGPGFRHIESAVAGEARKRDIHEAERRGFAAGGDVPHKRSLDVIWSVFGRPYADAQGFTRNP